MDNISACLHCFMCVLLCPLEGTVPLQLQGSCASKPGKPKGKKKCSSRQKFDVCIYIFIPVKSDKS